MEGWLNQAMYMMAATVLALAPGFLFLLWFRRLRLGEPAALRKDNLRGPGDTMRQMIARLDDRFAELLVLFFLVPAAVVSYTLGAGMTIGSAPGRNYILQSCLATAVILSLLMCYAVRKLRERLNLLYNLDAELAVGRELYHLAWKGYRVFNDFPAGSDNIDHVLVGATGVFAVETKGRPRPNKERLGVDAKVIYDGEALYFPDNAKETAAVKRSREQAESLSQWLSGELGEPVRVQATLALPGWFVERRKQDDLLILYGLSSHYARLLRGPEVLGESKIGRIAERLEARNRGLEEEPAQGGEEKTKISPVAGKEFS